MSKTWNIVLELNHSLNFFYNLIPDIFWIHGFFLSYAHDNIWGSEHKSLESTVQVILNFLSIIGVACWIIISFFRGFFQLMSDEFLARSIQSLLHLDNHVYQFLVSNRKQIWHGLTLNETYSEHLLSQPEAKQHRWATDQQSGPSGTAPADKSQGLIIITSSSVRKRRRSSVRRNGLKTGPESNERQLTSTPADSLGLFTSLWVYWSISVIRLWLVHVRKWTKVQEHCYHIQSALTTFSHYSMFIHVISNQLQRIQILQNVKGACLWSGWFWEKLWADEPGVWKTCFQNTKQLRSSWR